MKNVLIVTLIALSSFAAGKYLFPPKPEVKEVIKVVEVEKKQEKKDKVTVTKKTKLPDGTVVIDTTKTERSTTTTDKKSQLDSSKTTKSANKFTIGVLYIKDVQEFGRNAEFGATITVPLLGNLKAQALGTTDKKVGLGLAMDF